MKKALIFSAVFMTVSFFPQLALSQATSVAAGNYHSVFLCGTGTCQATGNNLQGQLGNGTNTDSNVPANVNLVSNVVSIATGWSHDFFIKADGSVWAVGDNGYGQLGDSTLLAKNNAVQVYGLNSVTRASGGKFHSLFIAGGTAFSCGYNGNWQLGDGSATDRIYPVPVMPGVMGIAAGDKHSVFLKTDSTVWTAVTNYSGQFGDGTTNDSPTPVPSPYLDSIVAVAAGEYFSLYLKSDGTVWGSGYNFKGQLGNGANSNVNIPTQVGTLSGIIAIAAGADHSLFLKNDGTVWACGYNGDGELGDGTSLDKWSPIQIPGLSGITAISAGTRHSLFVKNDGTTWACGHNGYGQLGDGTNTYAFTPIQVTNLCVPPPTCSFTSDFTSVCVNGCINFTDLSTGSPTNWSWNFGDGNFAGTANPTHCYTTSGTYTVMLAASNAGGSDTAYQTITVNATDISGIVSYSGGPVTSGHAYLIVQGATPSQYDTVAVTVMNSSGVYSFTLPAPGNYYVRAEADSIVYSGLLDTYYGGEYLWDSSLVITHGCTAVDSGNILMLEPPALNGTGSISGVVYEGAGFGLKLISGSPGVMTNVIPGVPVKIGKNPGGSIVAATVTDAAGVYMFDSLPCDDYIIYTDIPGYPMDSSYHINIPCAGPDSLVNLDYYVDSNSVYIDLTTQAHSIEKNNSSALVYPNPAKDNVTFVFEVKENSLVNMELYNLQGEKINVILDRNFEKGKITQTINLDQYNITNGTYMIKANINNNNSYIKLVVIK